MSDTDRIERRDFTYVQVIYRDPHEAHRFLVGTPSAPEARTRADAYIARERGRSLPAREHAKIYFYPRNYVREARALEAQGKADWIER